MTTPTAPKTYEYLRQTKTWRNRAGVDLPICDLDRGHAENILRMLDRCARPMCWSYHLGEPSLPVDDGIEAAMAADFDAATSNPLAWLHRTPLYRAIAEQAEDPFGFDRDNGGEAY
jgi:hypothetical protein